MGASVIYTIIVDSKQGYHKVTVYKIHRERLAFFAPNYKKYTLKVMPFGTMNPPSFYTFMVDKLRIVWHTLLLETVRKMKVISDMTVRVTDADEIYLNGIKTFSGSKGKIKTS